jgi:hypothetical protein
VFEVARDVPVEPEKDKDSPFSTFLSAAPEMPKFSENELALGLDRTWQRQVAGLFRRVEQGAPTHPVD